LRNVTIKNKLIDISSINQKERCGLAMESMPSPSSCS